MNYRTRQWPVPPSVNGLYLNVRGRGRAKTAKYHDWISEVNNIELCRGPRETSLTGPLEVVYTVHPFSDKRRRDLENYTKALSDQLTRLKIIGDDSQIICSTIKWGLASGGVLVEVRETVPVAA